MRYIVTMGPANRKYILTVLSLTVLAALFAAINVIPKLRGTVRGSIIGMDREVLAKAEADLTGKGDRYMIAKVITPDSLALEFYRVTAAEPPNKANILFESRVVLPEKRDAYINFRGREANLILADVDNDGTLEVIAPTFDENLIPRLNVYKLEPQSNTFLKVRADQIQL